jgi:hypothetical protein
MPTLPLSLSSVEGSRRLHLIEGRFIGTRLDTDTTKGLKRTECSVLQGRKQEEAEDSWLGLAS